MFKLVKWNYSIIWPTTSIRNNIKHLDKGILQDFATH